MQARVGQSDVNSSNTDSTPSVKRTSERLEMKDVVGTNKSIVSKSIVGSVAMPRKRSYEATEFEAFRAESRKKAAKAKNDHLASLNGFREQHLDIKPIYEMTVETIKEDASAYINQLNYIHETTFVALRETVQIQKSQIDRK